MSKLHTPAEISAAGDGAVEVLKAIRPDATDSTINEVVEQAKKAYEEFYAKSDADKVADLMERSQILTMRYMEVSGMFTAAVQAMKMAKEEGNIAPVEAFLDMLVPTKDALTKH